MSAGMVQTAPIAESKRAAAARAGGSSFYFAMRILPREQREAMFEVYAFCKAVDDIADGDLPRPARQRRLADWRRKIQALDAGETPAGMEALARAKARFSLRSEDFLAILEGMEMDAAEDIRAPDLATLDRYCDRVASAVGRLSVRIFGIGEQDGKSLAHHLGRALQLTNILRDIDEDAQLGRLYLPSEALAAAGIPRASPARAVADPNIAAACAPLVAKARGHFAAAARIMDACPRATTRSPRLMASVYGAILDSLVAQGFSAPRRRVRIAKARVLWAVLRHGLW